VFLQVVANDEKIIYDVDCDWPGCAHDARIWRRSAAKHVLEQQALYFIAGDSAYPIGPILMKPFSTAEAAVDETKRLFNQRLSGLRTVMTENVYGVWKRRFPCLREMRNHLPTAKKIIVATAILHNLSIFWNDEVPLEPEVGLQPNEPRVNVAQEYLAVRVEDQADILRMAVGQQMRLRLVENMPPRTLRETRRYQ
jgi:hypothetical protein